MPPAPAPDPLSAPTADAALRTPRSPAELFLVFNRLALQGFGGVLPVAQRELVERERWMSAQQFLELLSVAQVLPGPNIVNLSLMFGDRWFGWRGALAALAGMMLMPLLIVLVLATLYARFAAHPAVAGALRGMGAVAAGLIIATAVKLARTLRGNAMGLLACTLLAAATLIAVGWLHWALAWVVLGLGSAGIAWAWHRLGSTP